MLASTGPPAACTPHVPGGPCSGREGVQPLISRPGGAAATRAAALDGAEPDHGLPGDPRHGPDGRRPAGLVRLPVEPHTGHTEGTGLSRLAHWQRTGPKVTGGPFPWLH